jgi:hypothetical protein
VEVMEIAEKPESKSDVDEDQRGCVRVWRAMGVVWMV